MKRVCCVCRKVEHEGQWYEYSVATVRSVSHVYCPHCYQDLMDEIDRYALHQLSKTVYTVRTTGAMGIA